MKALQRHLGWKLFISHLLVVVIGGSVLIVIAYLHTSSVTVRHVARFDALVGEDPLLRQEIRESFLGGVREILAVGTVTAFVAAVATSSFIARRIVGPVRHMVFASQRIAAGEYHERVPVVGRDELAELAMAFNRMAEGMEQTEQRRLALIGSVAHELRTPLTSLQLIMEGLVDGVLPLEPATLNDFSREFSRLHRLVDDLQDLSRVESGRVMLHRQPEDLAALIRATAHRLRPQFDDKGVNLELSLPDQAPAALLDPDRITQVLTNVMGNALHFTPPGGRVTVLLEVRRDELVVTVEDTGIGIPAEHLPHIFERFYRVDKSRSRTGGGSGIGLTVAKHLIEAHGGHISAGSPGPGAGSRFTVSIPRS